MSGDYDTDIVAKRDVAVLIANAGLGDSITMIGMANYISTKYKYLLFSTTEQYRKIVELFFTDNPKIIVYAIDRHFPENMFVYDMEMHKYANQYDIYSLGHFGTVNIDQDTYYKKMRDGTIRKIINDYPVSYYSDLRIPIEVMTKYFSVTYPDEILKKYELLFNTKEKYRVLHQIGSTGSIDMLSQMCIDVDDMLTIDVNKNLYPKEHKYHEICDVFVNLPSIVYYAKLLENACELYLMDSCIHALGLIVDISKANPRVCIKRTPKFDYGIPDKFQYLYVVY